jgi:hypothetical protein
MLGSCHHGMGKKLNEIVPYNLSLALASSRDSSLFGFFCPPYMGSSESKSESYESKASSSFPLDGCNFFANDLYNVISNKIRLARSEKTKFLSDGNFHIGWCFVTFFGCIITNFFV